MNAANDRSPRGVVLVADDDAVTRRLLDHHLRGAGYQTALAADGDEAMTLLSSDTTLALFDLQMPKLSGLECLKIAHSRFPDLPVLVISQFGEVRDAVGAMKAGAFEYIAKPIDPEELLVHVRQALRSSRLADENRQLRQAVGGAMPSASFLGQSPSAHLLAEQVERIKDLDATVLVTGESGTGKSTLARLIHQRGPRSSHPFVAVSCAALPRDLIEAELFGHARGAFTGAVSDRPGRAEIADGGTLFLDEVGDMPLELQPKLLTFLQERTLQRIGEAKVRKVNVRVIAATHQDLEAKCRQGTFRQDLYFRLNVLPIRLAPLRERKEDLPLLADAVLERIARQRGSPSFILTPDAREALVAYAWPGNIRELENVLERASAFCESSRVAASDLGLSVSATPSSFGKGYHAASSPSEPLHSLAGMTLADIERKAILDTLHASGGNKKAAARMLGIDEKSIYNKMKRLGIRE